MVRRAVALGVFTLVGASFAWAGSGATGGVDRYLFDARVHVAVLARADGTGGELCWRDTVSGRTGEAAFVREGRHLLVESGQERYSEAHLLPDVALVVDDPPWGLAGGRASLGVALE